MFYRQVSYNKGLKMSTDLQLLVLIVLPQSRTELEDRGDKARKHLKLTCSAEAMQVGSSGITGNIYSSG